MPGKPPSDGRGKFSKSSAASLTIRKRSRSLLDQESTIKAPSPQSESDSVVVHSEGTQSKDSQEVTLAAFRKSKWNPRDSLQMKSVKEAFHASTVPEIVVCREAEQKSILEFCKSCIQLEKPGSLYVCGCPGTGKTMSIEKILQHLVAWSKDAGHKSPDVLMFNCTTLPCRSSIIKKVHEKFYDISRPFSDSLPQKYLQELFSQKIKPSRGRMMILVLDEMDYLITRDNALLHDLFMLTTFPFSPCILIGIANAIDLTDRFLSKLKLLNCEPVVVNFLAYSKDQILEILSQRLNVLDFDIFEPPALEFCARKVAAATGDIRRALDICRNAIEALEEGLRTYSLNKDINMVTFDHMQAALSKAFQPATVEIIQSLPHHQQIILCSITKLYHQCTRNATTIMELNKTYSEICKSNQIPAIGIQEFTNMCGNLSDQGILKLGKSKDDKQRTVTLQIDGSDVLYALKGIRFFANCMEL